MATSYKEWPTVSLRLNGSTVKRYKDYPRLTPDECKGIFNSAAAPPRIDELKDWQTPTYMLVDHSKKLLLERMQRSAVNAQGIQRDVQAAGGKLGKGMGVADFRQVGPALKKIREALGKDELAEAGEAAAELGKLRNIGKLLREEIEDLEGKIEEKVERQIEEARDHAEDHPDAARELLQDLAKAFKGHKLEARIRKALKDLPR